MSYKCIGEIEGGGTGIPSPEMAERMFKLGPENPWRDLQKLYFWITGADTPQPVQLWVQTNEAEQTEWTQLRITVSANDRLNDIKRDLVNDRRIFINSDWGQEQRVSSLMRILSTYEPLEASYVGPYGLWLYKERDFVREWKLSRFAPAVTDYYLRYRKAAVEGDVATLIELNNTKPPKGDDNE